MKKINFSQEQISWMIEQYQSRTLSLKAIGEKFNVSRGVITRIMKENDIDTTRKYHKYKADYRKFQTIDSPEKAYWLGFIAADGCIYKRVESGGSSVLINIHQKDRKQLENFVTFMDSDVRIIDHIQNDGFSNNTPMCKIAFNSNDMVEDFIDKGITPRKSLTLKPPKIEKEFYLPFILGYFDGDGSIYKNSQYNNYTIEILGTKELLTWVNDILNISCTLEKRKKDESNNYYIRCGGTNKPYQIMKQLYDSCPTCLERKFKIFKELETVVLNRNVK